MTTNVPKLTFEVYQGPALIKRVDFEEQSITIGRSAKALLPVDDPQLSDMHAVINVEADGSVSLLDLGSDRGIEVDGQRVQNATLQEGSSFSVGTLQFRMSFGGALRDRQWDDVSATPVSQNRVDVAGGLAIDEDDMETTYSPAAIGVEDDITDDGGSDELLEDGLSFVFRSGTGRGDLGVNKKRRKVLEVNQLWQDTLIDTKHFSRTMSDHVTIGSAVGWKWHFLGIDMGWVPSSLSTVLRFTPPMWSEVNSDWRNDFYAPDDTLPNRSDHQLFELRDEEYVAHVLAGWDGFVDYQGRRYTFDELVSAGLATQVGRDVEIPMIDELRLMVDIDGVLFFSQLVWEGQRLLQRSSEDIDYPLLATTSFMGFLGLMFGLVMYFSPAPADNALVELEDRFVELLLEQPEEPKPEKKPDTNPDAGEGAKAKKEEGKVGKKEAKREKAKGNKVEVQKKELDREVAENAGALGALRDNGALEGMFGSSALDSNLQGGVGGLLGAKGSQFGSGGLGARGGGLGGGGSAEGLGGLGTKGIGSGASGYGKGGGNFGKKGTGGLGRVGGDPIILGALDRSLIDEVVKRHMSQIRFCYQKELNQNPSLSGKIVVKFVIAKDGSVSSASKKSSTMNNAKVESCINGRFLRMQFPQPKGGGLVIVSYPFLFSPG